MSEYEDCEVCELHGETMEVLCPVCQIETVEKLRGQIQEIERQRDLYKRELGQMIWERNEALAYVDKVRDDMRQIEASRDQLQEDIDD